MNRLHGCVISSQIRDAVVRFLVCDPEDSIQSRHFVGAFYEEEELAMIAEYWRGGSVFVDIGANVGNHTVYAGVMLGADRIIAFEANPDAVQIFDVNIKLNDLSSKVCRKMIALGSEQSKGNLIPDTRWPHNLGGTKVFPDRLGSVEIRRGDEFVLHEDVGFIKIDVEGMELEVLEGLSATIQRYRPTIFVEVEASNETPFTGWLTHQNYVSVKTHTRYSGFTNHVVLPNEGLGRLEVTARRILARR